jgi:hypothetical protein
MTRAVARVDFQTPPSRWSSKLPPSNPIGWNLWDINTTIRGMTRAQVIVVFNDDNKVMAIQLV